MIQRRGMLTDRIRKYSEETLGYEITQIELRLMPYILDTMMNDQKLDPRKLNNEERGILCRWKTDGHVEGGISGIRITEEFWNAICGCVRLGYVDLTD